LSLELKDVDLDNRLIIPQNENNQTKRSWVSFYNKEYQEYLLRYLQQRNPSDSGLFQFAYRTVNRWFETTKKETGINITPQRLREWFCCEMGRLGVQDRYVDAFCGRVPKSVLARSYTDHCPERLKRIYDRVNLKVVS
jgi:integrase